MRLAQNEGRHCKRFYYALQALLCIEILCSISLWFVYFILFCLCFFDTPFSLGSVRFVGREALIMCRFQNFLSHVLIKSFVICFWRLPPHFDWMEMITVSKGWLDIIISKQIRNTLQCACIVERMLLQHYQVKQFRKFIYAKVWLHAKGSL